MVVVRGLVAGSGWFWARCWWRRLHVGQCSRCRMSRAGWVGRVVNRRAISLRVSGICCGDPGWRLGSVAAAR
jgi:hypothetical protein